MAQARIVASLAELRHLARQEVVVVASMGLVASCTVFCNRGMFKSEGTSLFRMALVTKIRPGVRLYHLRTEAAMYRMAVRTLDFAFLNGMVGLSVYLRPDILVAGEAEGRFGSFQAMANIKGGGVDGVAGVTGNAHRLVLAHIPESQLLGAVVAGKTHGRFLGRVSLSVKGNDASFSSSISHMLAAGTMAGLAGCSCTGAIGNRLLCVNRLRITIVIVRMTLLARIGPHIVRDFLCPVHMWYQKKQGKGKERKKA